MSTSEVQTVKRSKLIKALMLDLIEARETEDRLRLTDPRTDTIKELIVWQEGLIQGLRWALAHVGVTDP
jgi:hypothetical protein